MRPMCESQLAAAADQWPSRQVSSVDVDAIEANRRRTASEMPGYKLPAVSRARRSTVNVGGEADLPHRHNSGVSIAEQLMALDAALLRAHSTTQQQSRLGLNSGWLIIVVGIEILIAALSAIRKYSSAATGGAKGVALELDDEDDGGESSDDSLLDSHKTTTFEYVIQVLKKMRGMKQEKPKRDPINHIIISVVGCFIGEPALKYLFFPGRWYEN